MNVEMLFHVKNVTYIKVFFAFIVAQACNAIIFFQVKKSVFRDNEIITWKNLCESSPAIRHIVELYGAFIEREHVIMFMEYMNGKC